MDVGDALIEDKKLVVLLGNLLSEHDSMVRSLRRTRLLRSRMPRRSYVGIRRCSRSANGRKKLLMRVCTILEDRGAKTANIQGVVVTADKDNKVATHRDFKVRRDSAAYVISAKSMGTDAATCDEALALKLTIKHARAKSLTCTHQGCWWWNR